MPESVAASYAVRRGDVLFNRTSETQEEVALAATYLGTERVVFGGFVIRGRPLDERLDPVYSGYALRAPCIRSQIIPLGQGAVRANVGQQNLGLVVAPLPPLPEQRAIATALSDVDGLLGALERLIAKKRDLKQAAMQQLLTGQTRWPGFRVKSGHRQTEVGKIPNDWDLPKLDSIIGEISMGPFGSDITVSNFVSAGVPVLSGANVASERLIDRFANYVSFAKAKSLKKAVASRGDIVVTHRGTIGQISYIPDDSEFDRYVVSQSQFRARFTKGSVNPAWVVLYFHSDSGSKRLLEGKGHTGVPAIAQPTKTFRNLSIPLPAFAEQTAVAEVLSDMDAELAALEERREKTRALKQGMMQELLTGRTRLI